MPGGRKSPPGSWFRARAARSFLRGAAACARPSCPAPARLVAALLGGVERRTELGLGVTPAPVLVVVPLIATLLGLTLLDGAGTLFQMRQPALEIDGLDRAGRELDHFGRVGRLERRDDALGDGGDRRLQRGGDVRHIAAAGEVELHPPPARRRQEARDAETQQQRIAVHRAVDRLTRQPLQLVLEQGLGGQGRLVARAARAAGGVAGLAFLEMAGIGWGNERFRRICGHYALRYKKPINTINPFWI